MLVPRHLRRPIGGRILSDGSEYAALDENAIAEAIEYFREQDVKAVAISFVWSVRNPSHEQRAAERVRAALRYVFVCTGNEGVPADPRIHPHPRPPWLQRVPGAWP